MAATTYPKSTDYQLAVQNPHIAFSDPQLAAAAVEKTPIGQPVLRGGAFAVTFHLTRGRQDWAVRCFKRELGDLEQRYTKISDALQRVAHPCFAQFEYQRQGVLVEGRRLPIVKMAWVQGVTLGAYIERHYGDAARIRIIAKRFREMLKSLESAGIAHGDLQHANIMVTDTAVTLIDYDGMYVPSIGLTYSNEIGHVNYQSPLRTGADFNATIDRFSAIVIMLTFRALERAPALWNRYGNTGEQLLFGRPDFLDPGASALMHDLIAIPNLKAEVEQLQTICRTPLAQIPTLEAFLAGHKVSATAAVALPTSSVRIRQYDVLRATDRLSILSRVGDRIEIVGQVIEIKQGLTRYGKPYAFINFGDWRKGAFRIILWPEALERFARRGLDISSFAGQWMSVVGIVEEYRAARHSLQIVVNDPNDLHILSGGAEAAKIVADGQGTMPPVAPHPQAAARPSAESTRSRNDEIRAALRQSTAAKPNEPPRISVGSYASPQRSSNPATSRTNDAIRQRLRSKAPPAATASKLPPKTHAPTNPSRPLPVSQIEPEPMRATAGRKRIMAFAIAGIALACAIVLIVLASWH